MGWCFLDFVVQLLSCVQLFATSWTAAHQASLSFTISQNLLKLMSFESVMPSNHLILCRPLLFLPSIVPSMRVFSNESALHMAKVLEFQHQSFQWILRVDFFYDGLVWSPCCPRDSQESSLAPVWKLPGWVKKVKVKSLSHVGYKPRGMLSQREGKGREGERTWKLPGP